MQFDTEFTRQTKPYLEMVSIEGEQASECGLGRDFTINVVDRDRFVYVESYQMVELLILNDRFDYSSLQQLNQAASKYRIGEFLFNDDCSMAFIPSPNANSRTVLGTAREFIIKPNESCHLMFELNNVVEMLEPLKGFSFPEAVKVILSEFQRNSTKEKAVA